MNAFEEHRNRQIIPRWLPLWSACDLIPDGVVDYSFLSAVTTVDELEKKEMAWRTHGTWRHAIDLVASAFVAGLTKRDQVRRAAKGLVRRGEVLSESVLEACTAVAEGRTPEHRDSDVLTELKLIPIREMIRGLKRKAKMRRADAFLYSDMAFYYSLLAQDKSASECMRIALVLGNENPLLLRSAARFYLHTLRDPEKSLSLLRGSRATRRDPTLMAAEIAISEAFDLRSRLKRDARRIVQAADHSPFELSELAGTVGTFEMRESSVKKAKQAFQVAAECPTENTLAQMGWAVKFLHAPDVMSGDCDVEHAYEADARNQFWDCKYQAALDSAEKWARFQPFAARPAVFASYIAAVSLEDHARAIRVARQAVLSSPGSFILHNNLAFSLAQAGDTMQAAGAIENAEALASNPDEHAIAAATRGLVAFRSGDEAQGRLLYKTAIGHFVDTKDNAKLTAARIFYAREEKRVGSSEYHDARALALAAADRVKPFGVKALEELERG